MPLTRLRWLFLPVFLLCCGSVYGQAVVGDVLAGKLVKPKAGVWAWYDLSESSSGEAFLVRLAVVDEEKVGAKPGFWLEMEVVPLVGYRSIYKMLVTGPANNPDNVHRLIQREGTGAPQEVSLEKSDRGKRKDKKEEPRKPKRDLVGREDVETLGGAVTAEHYSVGSGEDKSDIWLSDDVRPMGIVRMLSANGELKLRSYGEGGENARSVIDDKLPPEASTVEPDVKVEVHSEDDMSAAPREDKP